jgi:hypothetical protein
MNQHARWRNSPEVDGAPTEFHKKSRREESESFRLFRAMKILVNQRISGEIEVTSRERDSQELRIFLFTSYAFWKIAQKTFFIRFWGFLLLVRSFFLFSTFH